jgi:positive regulator of sigma E activity
MIGLASTLLVYLWHYLVARLLYDELLRPLLHGRSGGVMFGALAATVLAFLLVRRRGRRGRA